MWHERSSRCGAENGYCRWEAGSRFALVSLLLGPKLGLFHLHRPPPISVSEQTDIVGPFYGEVVTLQKHLLRNL